jgi:hypothetical protein
MWALFRVHDVFEAGTELDLDGQPRLDARALPDGEITRGTPIPAVIPLPTRAMAPLPARVQLVNHGTQVQTLGNGNPGFPFFVPGIVGHRSPHPPMDFAKDEHGVAYDGGLPRHVIAGGEVAFEAHTSYDFTKETRSLQALLIDEDGTPTEKAAMAAHATRVHPSFTPDGRPAEFLMNGQPAVSGAPFANPGVDDQGKPVGTPRRYMGADIQVNAVFNKKGWHYPQQRILSLWNDVMPTLSGDRPPEPLFFRANSGDVVEYWQTNLVPSYYEMDDFQVRTPTDILGQHIHQIALMRFFGLDPHFYELHVGIDNADNGHGALALQAVELYLDGIRASDGEQAMNDAWYRVWRGYVGFALTGNLGSALISLLVDPGPTLHEQVAALITAKKPYGQYNHGNLTVGPTRINNWFDDPEGFMRALIAAGYVVPGKPDASRFFQLVSFDGPMFRVFTDAEIMLLRDWTSWLATPAGKQAMAQEARTARSKASNALPAPPVSACAEPAAAASSTDPPPYDPIRSMIAVLRRMKEHQQGVNGHHVMLRGPDPLAPAKVIARPIKWWFDQIDDAGDAGALALMAALAHEDNGWIVKYDSARSPLVQNLMAGTGAMAQTLQRIAPDTLPMTPLQIAVALDVPPHLRPDDGTYTDDDGTVASSGLTSVEVVAIWIDAGCPLGTPGAAPSALVSLQHPTRSAARPQPSYVFRRRTRGMGSVH